MPTKKVFISGVISVIALLVTLATWLPVAAAQDTQFPAQIGTIEIGKQGLVISNVPNKVKYVSFASVKPPLPARYLQGVDIAYRGPAVELFFLDAKKEAISYSGASAQVYFNISVPEKNMWDAAGTDAIAIWHYIEESKQWEMCPTMLVDEKIDNGKYDRLACFAFQNGIYMLGKLAFDPVFPLWFKPYDKGDPMNSGPMVYQSELFTAKAGTFEFGKQGVVLNEVPAQVKYIAFERIQPPLPARYHLGVDIAYRGPAVQLAFINPKNEVIDVNEATTQIFFNISTPEKKMWDAGGPEAIAIWHYNDEEKSWELCPTFYVPEKLDNGKYDRLTCYASQNGIYMLGKLAFDKVFPLWFKTYDKDSASNLAALTKMVHPE